MINTSSNFSFINECFQEFHQIENSISQKSDTLDGEINDLCKKIETKAMDLQKDNKLFSELNEIKSGLLALRDLIHKKESLPDLFYKFFFGDSKPEKLDAIEEKITTRLINLSKEHFEKEIAEDLPGPEEGPKSLINRVILLSDLKKNLDESAQRIVKTADKVNWIIAFLHDQGWQANEALSQKETFFNFLSNVKQLSSKLDSQLKQIRLPVNYGDVLEKAKMEAEKVSIPQNDFEVDKQQSLLARGAMQVLANVASPDSLKEVDQDLLGDRAYRSQTNAIEALRKFSGSTQTNRLISCLEKARDIDLKLDEIKKVLRADFGAYLPSHEEYLKMISKLSEQFAEPLKRFELKKTEPANSSLNDQEVIKLLSEEDQDELLHFFEKTNALKLQVSQEALINDVCLDIIEQNKSLKKPGDIAVINGGIAQHALIIQFAKEEDDTYSISVINTGFGLAGNHAYRDKEHHKAKPLKIAGLKLEDITDLDFIKHLVTIKISDTKGIDQAEESAKQKKFINQMYAKIRNFCIAERGGKDVSQTSDAYTTQKLENCSYSCIEAWLELHLRENIKGYRLCVLDHIIDALAKNTLFLEKHGDEIVETYGLMNINLQSNSSENHPNELSKKISKVAQQNLQLLKIAMQQKERSTQSSSS